MLENIVLIIIAVLLFGLSLAGFWLKPEKF